MTLIEAVAAVLSKYVTIWPREVDERSACRLAPVLKTIFHQCVISYTCSQSYSDGSVLKQSHQSKTGYKYMMWHIDEKLF